MRNEASAFAPASIGNVAVGFDMLGLAIEGVGDWVHAVRTTDEGISISAVYGIDGELHPYLPADPAKNTASIAAQSFWNTWGDTGGAALVIRKGVPLQSGMGSSAASAVAAVVAVNALLEAPLPAKRLLPFALEGEKFASGGLHADNVAPSLLGGLVLCPTTLLPDVVSLPVPPGVMAVLVHPELSVNTAEARKALTRQVTLELWLEQQGYLATFIAACTNGDVDLLRKSLRDVIIEPQRRSAVSCFDAVTTAARDAGALGCSLSGSGPSLFALAETDDAAAVQSAMVEACQAEGIECQSWISGLDAPGASISDDGAKS